MITCPSCNHQNPEGSLQCENCYTPLPATASCPNCGASVQTDATFCGQCGFNLQAESASVPEEIAIDSLPNTVSPEVSLPDEMPLSNASADVIPEDVSYPIQSPWDEEVEPTIAQTQQMPEGFPDLESAEPVALEETEIVVPPDEPKSTQMTSPWESAAPDLDLDLKSTAASADAEARVIEPPEAANPEQSETIAEYVIPFEGNEEPEAKVSGAEAIAGTTRLQIDAAYLLHVQSNSKIEIPISSNIVHVGKPNAQIPPDIDLAGFPDSEVVSRVHADIRIEGDAYYIEDVGSSNGTYINHTPLPQGNRHRLRAGDRIALGKGDLVTFIFQTS